MKPKIYIAGRWHMKEDLRKCRRDLEKLGCEVTSRWLDTRDIHYTEKLLAQHAENDVNDIVRADSLVAVFHEGVTGYQGTFFEIGLAVGLGMPVYIVGSTTCIFRHLDSVSTFKTWNDFLVGVEEVTK